jgi:CubicO group peptidase (beta-lactamase class C family)
MLLNGGKLDDVRIIGSRTLQFMASDQLGPNVTTPPQILPGHSFGLGFAVRTQAGLAPFAGSVGQHYWGGMAGTFFFIDPAEDLFTVFMMQAPGQREYIRAMLRNLVYAAVE